MPEQALPLVSPTSPPQLPADLLAVLACPSPDHAPLNLAESGTELICSFCATRFAITDGIPVLLPDAAIPGPNGLGQNAQAQNAQAQNAQAQNVEHGAPGRPSGPETGSA